MNAQTIRRDDTIFSVRERLSGLHMHRALRAFNRAIRDARTMEHRNAIIRDYARLSDAQLALPIGGDDARSDAR